MINKLKQTSWKKILLIGVILMIPLIVNLRVQKLEGKTIKPFQPSKELKLSDFPEVFKNSTLIIIDYYWK